MVGPNLSVVIELHTLMEETERQKLRGTWLGRESAAAVAAASSSFHGSFARGYVTIASTLCLRMSVL